MTAAQRALLDKMAVIASDHMVSRGEALCIMTVDSSVVDALRAALGTCGNCAHLDDYMGGFGACAAPPSTGALHPFRYKLMPIEQRCSGWTAKEGA